MFGLPNMKVFVTALSGAEHIGRHASHAIERCGYMLADSADASTHVVCAWHARDAQVSGAATRRIAVGHGALDDYCALLGRGLHAVVLPSRIERELGLLEIDANAALHAAAWTFGYDLNVQRGFSGAQPRKRDERELGFHDAVVNLLASHANNAATFRRNARATSCGVMRESFA